MPVVGILNGNSPVAAADDLAAFRVCRCAGSLMAATRRTFHDCTLVADNLSLSPD
jgi:hypothetical protein